MVNLFERTEIVCCEILSALVQRQWQFPSKSIINIFPSDGISPKGSVREVCGRPLQEVFSLFEKLVLQSNLPASPYEDPR